MRSGRTSVQVINCCRKGGKQELVNASFFALNRRVELFLSISGFMLLVQEVLLCVPLLCGAAAGQSVGHCCILCSRVAGSPLRGAEPGRAVSMAVQRSRFCSLFCVTTLQGGWNLFFKKCNHQCKWYNCLRLCGALPQNSNVEVPQGSGRSPRSNMPGCRQAILTALVEDIAVRRFVLWCREFSALRSWCGLLEVQLVLFFILIRKSSF